MVDKQDVINLFENIQEQDLEECFAASGLKDKDAVMEAEYNAFQTLEYSEPIYRDGKLCAIVGFKKLFIDEHEAMAIIVLTTKEIVKRKFDYFRQAIKLVNKAKKVCSKLLFCTLSSYKEALSMNKRLGFKHYRDIEINGRKFEIDMLGV